MAPVCGMVIMKSNNTGSQFYIDYEDFDRVKNYSWCENPSGYLKARINKHNVYLHRFIKNSPKGVVIDHKNCKKYDNRKDNLRECNMLQNTYNRGKTAANKCGFKGVYYEKNVRKYRAQISVQINGVKSRLRQYFNDAISASRQYDEWAKEHHGEFARLNNA